MNQGPFKMGGFTGGDQPAFPYPSNRSMEQITGMTLRQYVAIHAPVSLLDANESLHQTTKFGKPEGDGAFPMRQVVAESVRLSVMYADMLLAELAKDQGTAEVAQSLSEKDPA